MHSSLPTCRISSICVTEGGTRARGRDRASSNFTLRTMVFLKWSRASCRTEGSLPCTQEVTQKTAELSNNHHHPVKIGQMRLLILWTAKRKNIRLLRCTWTGWKMACNIERTSQKKKSQVSARESSNFWPASTTKRQYNIYNNNNNNNITDTDHHKMYWGRVQSYLRRTLFCPVGWPCLLSATGSVKLREKMPLNINSIKYCEKSHIFHVSEWCFCSHLLIPILFHSVLKVYYLKVFCEKGPQLSLQQMPGKTNMSSALLCVSNTMLIILKSTAFDHY